MQAYFQSWFKTSLFSFIWVGILGLLMRYKIAFDFPFFQQKFLLHAHSHFAFSGWVSLFLMAAVFAWMVENNILTRFKQAKAILIAQLISSYGMLFTFVWQGYALFSITFSTLTLLIFIWFAVLYFQEIHGFSHVAKKWFTAAVIFHLISILGTGNLSYIMATHQINTNGYLASIYFYLHFQYNGWFFFACMGLFTDFLYKNNILPEAHTKIFWLFALSCTPAYVLSVLWLKLPTWLLFSNYISAIAQFIAVIWFFYTLYTHKLFSLPNLKPIHKVILGYVGIALFSKFFLQVLSFFPSLAKLPFGFKAIAIAYLHLVLLACVSSFILFHQQITNTLTFRKSHIFSFLFFVFLNELVLGLQGLLGIFYIPFSYSNEALVLITIGILVSIVGLYFIRDNPEETQTPPIKQMFPEKILHH